MSLAYKNKIKHKHWQDVGNHHPFKNQNMAGTPEASHFAFSNHNLPLPLWAILDFMAIISFLFFLVSYPRMQP